MSITYGQRPGCTAAAHGTVWAYTRHRCRCPEAVAAKDRHRGPRRRPRPVDPARVDAAVRGENVRLTVQERRLAIARFAGRPATHAAKVLRLAPSTVYLHREKVAA